jgi:hypothetical protein
MAAEDVINTAYLRTLGRPADSEGLAFYSAQLEAGRPVGEILADLNFAVESGAESPALDSSDVDQFNNLVASGNYTQAADFAASKGVDPAVTADYINRNAANLNLPSDFGMNAADVSSLTGQVVGPVNPATGPTNYPSGNTITVDPAGVAAAQAQTSARDLLNRAYQTTLNRAPDQEGIEFYLPKIIDGTINADNIVPTITAGAVSGPDQQAAIDFALQTSLGEFDRLVASGDFTGAKSVLDQSINQYYLDPTASYANIAEYLNEDPKFADIRKANEGQLFDVDNVRSFGEKTIVPFGGYYAQPGIGPYGGVFGVGTEQFEQQSDPFSGAQARARSLINNRLTPLTDNVPIDPRPPAPFGGYVAANDVTPNPFAYRQTLSPNTLAALAAEATPASEAAASEAPMRRGGYINQGITAVRR